ncbi:MAG: radical SAM protein [Oscillospiraceae bacterium]|nr:radical SAM protein [Oscillospiraceae bacterium]
MKKTNISIFIPHIGCPHLCSFCDQKSISGAEKAPTAKEVEAMLEEQSNHLLSNGMSAEIAFFGGSFTAVPRDYMIELLETAKNAVEKFPAYSGIRCSTRPDCVDDEIVGILKRYNVSAVELGAQSMSDEVLKANERGHTSDDVRKASELIKNADIELGLQMMTGLYLDTKERSLDTCREFIKIKPKTVRIYPTVILENTRLGELYKSGLYESFSFEETVELCAKMLEMFTENGISVIRMGLHSSRELEEKMLGGAYHPSFREFVESRSFLNELSERLERFGKGRYTVLSDRKNISKIIGQKRENLVRLREKGYDIRVKEKSGAYLEIEEVKNL